MIAMYQLQDILLPVEAQPGASSEPIAAEQTFFELFAQQIAVPLPCSPRFSPTTVAPADCTSADSFTASLTSVLQEDAQEDPEEADRTLSLCAAYGAHLHPLAYASRELPQPGVFSTGDAPVNRRAESSLRAVETAVSQSEGTAMAQSEGTMETGRTASASAGKLIENGREAEQHTPTLAAAHEAPLFKEPDSVYAQLPSTENRHSDHAAEDEELRRSADVREEPKRRPVSETIAGTEAQAEVKPAFTKAVAGISPQTSPKPAAPIASQIIERIESATIKNGVKELSMELNPKELGRIHVKLELDEGHLVIRIEPKRADTHRLLGENIDKLIAGLELKDARIEHIAQTEAKAALPPYSGDTGSQHSFNAHAGSQQSGHNSRYETAAANSAFRQSGRAAKTEGIEETTIVTALKSSGIHRLDYIV